MKQTFLVLALIGIISTSCRKEKNTCVCTDSSVKPRGQVTAIYKWDNDIGAKEKCWYLDSRMMGYGKGEIRCKLIHTD